MINVSRLYCGIENSSDRFRYHSDGPKGAVAVYNCTNKCSQNCLHCYSRAGAASDELDTEQAKQLLNQLAEIKCAVVLFSGGEPLERTDLFELLEHSQRLRLRTAISSNGSLITSKIAKKIAGAGVNYVGISIDGVKQTHDSFRGVTGSFESAINGIKACKDAGLKAGMRFTITNRNFNQIGEIFSLAAELGISRICFYHLISAGRAIENNLKCTNQQIRQALNDILDNAAHYSSKNVTEVLTVGNHADGVFILNRLHQENSPIYEKTYELLQKFGGNKIGTKIFAVDACGNVHPDQFWRNFSMGNVTKLNLREILGKPFDIFRTPLKSLKPEIASSFLCGKSHKKLLAMTFLEIALNSGMIQERCRKCRRLKICGTNMRDGSLEPDCYLNDEEIGLFKNEFSNQNAKA